MTHDHDILTAISVDVRHIRACLDGTGTKAGLIERVEIMERESVTKRMVLTIGGFFVAAAGAIAAAWDATHK